MFVGKVIGTVWSTIKWPEVQGLKLLVVRPYHLADLVDLRQLGDAAEPAASIPQGGQKPAQNLAPNPYGGPDSEAVICVDLLDAGVGDDVVVAFGHAARVAAQSQGANISAHAAPNSKPFARPLSPASTAQSTGTLHYGPAAVPIDAAVVAIVDSIAVARPST